jgi:hypothetical protein
MVAFSETGQLHSLNDQKQWGGLGGIDCREGPSQKAKTGPWSVTEGRGN